MENDNRTWETQTTKIDEFWKPSTEGAQIEGTYTGDFKGGKGKSFLITTDENKIICTSNHKVLEEAMNKLNYGRRVRITYEGKDLNKEQIEFYKYKVEAEIEQQE